MSEINNNKNENIPWIEKQYKILLFNKNSRPKKISDVSSQNEVIQALKSSVESGNV